MKVTVAVFLLSLASTAQAFVPSNNAFVARTNNVSMQATVTAALVKELRERTAAGMMDCKKALVESDGDIELAIENMRKSGAVKAAKKSGKITAEGAVIVRSADGLCAVVEVNCQTDFASRDKAFQDFAALVADAAIANKMTSEELQAKFEEDRIGLVAKIGENISVRRVEYLEGSTTSSYIHGGRVAVILSGEGDEETLKHACMQVAASRPEYLKPESVPADVVEKERALQIEIAMGEGKPANIAEKMVTGRMKKFTGEVSLTGQAFIMEPKKTVGQYLKEKGAEVFDFKCMEVGEGVDKGDEMSYADEVASLQGKS